MDAVKITSFGEISKLAVSNAPKPIPVENEVLIQIKAASVNMSDVKEVKGLMPHVKLPRIPGRDFSGIVVQGPSLWIGKEVWGTGGDIGFTRDGSHAQFISVNIDSLRLKPTSLSFEEAGSVGVTFVTAFSALEAAGLTEGKDVVVIGANGQVGQAALQIAKWKGARKVIGTVRKNVEGLRERTNVDRIVDTSRENLKDQVISEFGKSADIVFDTVGAPTFAESLSLLGPGGNLTVIATPPDNKGVQIDLFDFYRRNLRLSGINTLNLDHIQCARLLDQMTPGFESGFLKPTKEFRIFPLSRCVEAYEATETGTKAILKPE